MADMKYNSYVYPYTPLKDLKDKTVRWELSDPRTVSVADLNGILASQPKIEPAIAGTTKAEQVLSIFLDPEILFGPAEFITDLRQDWLAALERFISKDEPIRFTLLGFPFKVPVKLKTDRVLPDMGELLILHRLDAIAKAIGRVYPRGAVIHIFTEGAFGPFVGVAKETADAYAQALQKMTADFGFGERLKIRDLSEMETAVPDFSRLFAEKITNLRERQASGDKAFKDKFDGAYGSIYRIVATDMYPDEDVMDAYNEALAGPLLPPNGATIRRDIESRVAEAVLKYHAYLEVRDDIGFLQQAVPDALALTVSPKPKRLGIIPVNRDCERLPYHGVAVLDERRNGFTIEYLIDIRREPRKFTPVRLEGDLDAAPFYYAV